MGLCEFAPNPSSIPLPNLTQEKPYLLLLAVKEKHISLSKMQIRRSN